MPIMPRWRAVFVLLLLPACFAVVSLILRDHGGPFWLWNNVDPNYFYLLDPLNLINLTTPGHPYHPGTPVQAIGALTLKAAYPFSSADAITQAVLADPEAHLRLISTVLIFLGTCALFLVGAVAQSVFGNVLLAMTLQIGPFLSKLVLKNAYHAKPEALLVTIMLILCMVVILALRPGMLDRHRARFAIAFGIVAGLGVATKITAAPMFLLPLFLLGRPRTLVVYGASSLAAFVFFVLPALGAYEIFMEWMARVALGSGDYGTGASTVIDVARYPRNVAKIMSRPIVSVVLVASLLTLAAVWRRHGRAAFANAETRALAGLGLALAAQVLLVAKQPNAMYMVPAFMLAPLAIVLTVKVIAGMEVGGEGIRRWSGRVFAGLLAVLVVAQGFSVVRLDRELTDIRDKALSIDTASFRKCAQVSFFPASGISFALLLGDKWTGSRFSKRLKARQPENAFWYDQHTRQIRDWDGPVDARALLTRYPCAVFRGAYTGSILGAVERLLPGLTFDSTCRTGGETILAVGADCKGRVIPPGAGKKDR
jgi:hypothetical protein